MNILLWGRANAMAPGVARDGAGRLAVRMLPARPVYRAVLRLAGHGSPEHWELQQRRSFWNITYWGPLGVTFAAKKEAQDTINRLQYEGVLYPREPIDE